MPDDLDRILAAPVEGVKHETAPGFDRPAEMHGNIGRDAKVDIQLLKHRVQANARDRRTDPDSQSAV